MLLQGGQERKPIWHWDGPSIVGYFQDFDPKIASYRLKLNRQLKQSIVDGGFFGFVMSCFWNKNVEFLPGILGLVNPFICTFTLRSESHSLLHNAERISQWFVVIAPVGRSSC